MVNGRRITDAETLKVVTMVYGGLVKLRISLPDLQARGVNALGLTGADMDGNPFGKASREGGGFMGFVGRCEAGE